VEETVAQQRKMTNTISDLQRLILVPFPLLNEKIGNEEENREGNETLIGFEKGK
jgi:hypothetical protein